MDSQTDGNILQIKQMLLSTKKKCDTHHCQTEVRTFQRMTIKRAYLMISETKMRRHKVIQMFETLLAGPLRLKDRQSRGSNLV